MVRMGLEEYSLARPCLQCSKVLRQYSNKMRRKGSCVWVRYSLGGGGGRSAYMSDWVLGIKLGDGLMSSGWREKYRILRNSGK
jgi:hypothetical protein